MVPLRGNYHMKATRSRTSYALVSRRSCASRVLDSALRSTQAAESLREAFARSSGATTVVTSTDLDYFIGSRKTRPSIMVDIYSGVGFLLGTSSRLMSPLPECKKALIHSVDEACRRSINDELRNMRECEETNDTDEISEVKETLKYHRDISLSSEEAIEEFAGSKLVNVVTAGIHSAIRITSNI